ncbi:DUF2637 domain-containing protein [Nocardia sp. NPDC005978]|uniref:DUF2637 domain-containing protein n=1 Tax=Nocardia sp. NPDC005978 TaxID=3156725 RepID=UPI0033BA8D09
MSTKVTATLVVRALAVAAILTVGLAAFRLSFVTLRELAVMARIPAGDAWLFPVIIDITTAIAAVMALVTTDPAVRKWFSWVLGIGTAVSIAGNAVHAVVPGDRLPVWACAVVAAVAPIALLVDVHGLVLILRAPQPIPAPVAPSPAAEPVAESVAVPEPVADPVAVLADVRDLTPLPDPPMVAMQVAVNPPPRTRPISIPVGPPLLPVTRP